MSDLFEEPQEGSNAHEYTVAELSGAVKRTIEGTFGRVRVRGEVGRVVRARSGHLYFDMKDDKAVIASVCWKGQAARLEIQPEEGMEVIATGRLTTYAGQSKYQLVVEALAPAGIGALMAMLEKRRRMLEAEGLFAAERKKPLPWIPGVIGVVTSPSGAVIRDILHRLRERFPRPVLIWPVAVQGKACAPEVARAIRGFNALPPGGPIPRPDLIIVARGGGSVEDLWGFNEEEVVRAAAESAIPLISAVGHETDTTLIDFASDMRAPTPTAAAELAVPVRLELLARVDELGARLSRALLQGLERRGQRLRDLARALPRPESLLENARQRLDRAGEGLPRALGGLVQTRRLALARQAAAIRPQLLAQRLRLSQERCRALGARLRPALLERDIARRSERLEALSRRFALAARAGIERARKRLDALERMRQSLGYTETLKRGYAVVRGDGHVVSETAAARAARALEIEFADGRLPLGAAAGSGSAAKAPGPKGGTARRRGGPGKGTGGADGGSAGGQGSLF